MFTGLIESKGQISALEKKEGMTRIHVRMSHPEILQEPFGASIAVNGCCLTVAQIQEESIGFDVSSESLKVTNLGDLQLGSEVNLERAMKLGDRLGGHLVSGHVDTVGDVVQVSPDDEGWLVKVQVPKEWSPLIIHKGSICIDGTSLTVNELEDLATGTVVSLMIIPATLQETIISSYKEGQKVNIELDMMAKFVQRQSMFK